MTTFAKEDLLNLSISERIQLVEDLWDSIANIPESVQVTDEQKIELDRRLDDYERNPHLGSPWHLVRDRIGSRN